MSCSPPRVFPRLVTFDAFDLFASNSDWFIALLSSVVIGQCNYLRQATENRSNDLLHLKLQNLWQLQEDERGKNLKMRAKFKRKGKQEERSIPFSVPRFALTHACSKFLFHMSSGQRGRLFFLFYEYSLDTDRLMSHRGNTACQATKFYFNLISFNHLSFNVKLP